MSNISSTTFYSMCFTSFFSNIPSILNNSGLLSDNLTFDEEKQKTVQSFVQKSIQGTISLHSHKDKSPDRKLKTLEILNNEGNIYPTKLTKIPF